MNALKNIQYSPIGSFQYKQWSLEVHDNGVELNAGARFDTEKLFSLQCEEVIESKSILGSLMLFNYELNCFHMRRNGLDPMGPLEEWDLIRPEERIIWITNQQKQD